MMFKRFNTKIIILIISICSLLGLSLVSLVGVSADVVGNVPNTPVYTHSNEFVSFMTDSRINQNWIAFNTWYCVGLINDNVQESVIEQSYLTNDTLNTDLGYYSVDFANSSGGTYTFYYQVFYRLTELDPNNSPYDFYIEFAYKIISNKTSAPNPIRYGYSSFSGDAFWINNQYNLDTWTISFAADTSLNYKFTNTSLDVVGELNIYPSNYFVISELIAISRPFEFSDTSFYKSWSNYKSYLYYSNYVNQNSSAEDVILNPNKYGLYSFEQFTSSKEKAYNEGYQVGYDRATELNSDGNLLGNMMLSIVDVPINIFNSIFNFDILGINLAHFIMGLVSVLIIAWVLKKVL